MIGSFFLHQGAERLLFFKAGSACTSSRRGALAPNSFALGQVRGATAPQEGAGSLHWMLRTGVY